MNPLASFSSTILRFPFFFHLHFLAYGFEVFSSCLSHSIPSLFILPFFLPIRLYDHVFCLISCFLFSSSMSSCLLSFISDLDFSFLPPCLLVYCLVSYFLFSSSTFSCLLSCIMFSLFSTFSCLLSFVLDLVFSSAAIRQSFDCASGSRLFLASRGSSLAH